jgi:holo-[acyl-carrier protein] synthase
METIYGIGVDIVNIARITQAIQRWGEKFLQRTFTRQEMAYCASKTFPTQHYAVRFAAKEAVFKALGTGWNYGVGWLDIEVLVDPTSGQPMVTLSGKALAILGDPASFRVLISLSHDKEYAIAQAVIVRMVHTDGDHA